MIFLNESEFLQALRMIIREELETALKVNKDRLISTAETARRLNISTKTLSRMTQAGEIRATILRNRPSYQESEVQRIISNKRKG